MLPIRFLSRILAAAFAGVAEPASLAAQASPGASEISALAADPSGAPVRAGLATAR